MKDFLEKIFGKTAAYVPILIVFFLVIAWSAQWQFPDNGFAAFVWGEAWRIAAYYLLFRFAAEPLTRWVVLKAKQFWNWVTNIF